VLLDLSSDFLCRKAVLVGEYLVRSGVTEVIHADLQPATAYVAFPTECCAGLDADPARGFGRQHRVFIGLVLGFEKLPAGHGDNADLAAVGAEQLSSVPRFFWAGHKARLPHNATNAANTGIRNTFCDS